MFTFSRFKLLFPWQNRRLAEQIGGQLARECRADIWQCRHQRLAMMSIAAIRGYVRAEGGERLASKIDHILPRQNLKPALRKRVLDAATDQLIGMVLRDVLAGVTPIGQRSLAA